ncbi:CvpA family protein [Desulfobaculum bizertense]|uniref:Colicin V production protein n=1 Tax=Desulfobaculum bizertense DSM 18034 TaxID=1121442 RepID=A0A1T4WCV6_9BACT|nr:CvpA family protein [Desulfobaculum bizertense]UIJ37434.1 CvpA family protein [Desulfobaculum bizertense]SKA74858.1 Colicin V production protein [Desulfobaculum bizertense DSM 18034]
MFNALDIVFAVIGVYYVIRGVFRGFMREVLSMLGLLFAYWLANAHGEALVPYFSQWIKSPGILSFLSYLSVFVGAVIGVGILAWLVVKVFRIRPVPLLDIPGGGLAGLFKAGVFCCVILVGINSYLPDYKGLQDSKIAPYLEPGVEALQYFTPDRMRNFDPTDLQIRLDEQRKAALEDFLNGTKDEARELQEEAQNFDARSEFGDAKNSLSERSKKWFANVKAFLDKAREDGNG